MSPMGANITTTTTIIIIFITIFINRHSGAQLGIFKGRGPIHEKVALETFQTSCSLRILLCRFIIERSIVLRLTDIIALKANDSYCYLLSLWSKENMRAGHEKVALETFQTSCSLRILLCRFIIERSIVLRLTDIIALKANDSYCYLLSLWSKENMRAGRSPGQFVEPSLFHVGKRPF